MPPPLAVPTCPAVNFQNGVSRPAQFNEDSSYPAYRVKPVMMYCGQDLVAKETVGKLIAQLGWDPLDVGGLEQALHLEHMTLLWVRMVRVNGHSPNIVWAMLTR